MNKDQSLFKFLQRGIKYVAAIMFAVVVLTVTANAQATIIAVSDFETNADGWQGLACPNPGLCAVSTTTLTVEHLPAGGNPNGYIRTQDPSSVKAGRALPPAKFSDNYALGQIISFDVRVETNGGTGGIFDTGAFGKAPLVTIESGGSTLVYGTADFPTIDGGWKHYDVPLSDDPAWLIFDGTLRALGAGEFATVFGGRTRLTIISEWLKDNESLDTGGLDNVMLTAVPIPAALPLLLSALGGLGFTKRRR
jgi:hypothetical protein